MRKALALVVLTTALVGSIGRSWAVEPLVSVDWVKANIGKPGVFFLDVRGEGRIGYMRAHIPGAVFSDYGRDDWRVKDKNGTVGMLPPPEAVEKLVGGLGIFTPQTAPQWLGGTPLTVIAVVIMEIWWGLGFHTMFFLAGLAAIPKDLYEAAKVDGAGEWDLFINITLPHLRPIMIVLIILRFGTAMAVIDEFLILGGFNRASSTYTWTVYMYDLSFKIGQWAQGRAAAIGWIGAVIMMIVVVGMLYLFQSDSATEEA